MHSQIFLYGKVLFILSCLFLPFNLPAQRTETIYLAKGDSTYNYYTALVPDSASKGLIVVMGGFCTDPQEVMMETKLPVTACKAGYTVVIPFMVNDCETIDVDNDYQKRLETLIPELRSIKYLIISSS